MSYQLGVGRGGSLAYPVDPSMCFGVLYATNALSERVMTQRSGPTKIALAGTATADMDSMSKRSIESWPRKARDSSFHGRLVAVVEIIAMVIITAVKVLSLE